MLVYNYTQETKEYSHCTEAYFEPEYNTAVLPANGTFIKPVQPKKGFVAVFDKEKEKWEELEDNRGTYYDIRSPKDEVPQPVGWHELGPIVPWLTKKVRLPHDEWNEEKEEWEGNEEFEKELFRWNNSPQRKRDEEYPGIKDQLDMLYWDKINGTNNWVDSITKVKEKYPKPENENG
jgi:hypothetical protein